MQRPWASSKGFTILEILVTIVVIGVLATITIISYNGIQQRSRDATRDNNIAQIKVALEKYYADNSQFPGVCSGDGVGCAATNLSSALSPYMSSIPQDPLYAGQPNNDYQYVRGGTSGNAYGLKVTYEVKEVCKTGTRIVSSWWGTGTPDCADGGLAEETPPTIITTSLSTAYINFAYSHTVSSTGTLPMTYTIQAGSLPPGTTINATTGQISGTPTVGGTYNFTVRATNSAGFDDQALSIVVSLVSPP